MAERSTNSARDYFVGTEREKALGLLKVMDSPDPWAGTCKKEALRLYHGMLLIRVVDRRMMALQRQGRISFYGEALGQEAAVVGSARALNPQDWLVPALREAGAGLFRGLTLDSYIAQIFGNENDICKGRQMPCHPCDPASNYVVMSSCVSTQLPHAVGIAMGMKLTGDSGKVCFGYMGDGGTSEGDFHIALNFAGVTKVPVVLICQNNQWAISTPGTCQTASETIALKGLGYGVESLRADGNDVLAVKKVCSYAAEKARRGEGPTFIELLTYRVSAHSSSDDPSRYREPSVTEHWQAQSDPLQRMLSLLEERGWYSAAESAAWAAEIEAEVRRVVARQEEAGKPGVRTLVTDVFEQPTWLLEEQYEQLKQTPTIK